MTHPVSLFGAAALGVALAFSWTAEAQTVHHRAKHPRAAGEAGRQITVRHARRTVADPRHVGARRLPQRLCSRHSAAAAAGLDEDTFVGLRGLSRLPNQYSLPELNRPLIDVAWPGYNGPLLGWH